MGRFLAATRRTAPSPAPPFLVATREFAGERTYATSTGRLAVILPAHALLRLPFDVPDPVLRPDPARQSPGAKARSRSARPRRAGADPGRRSQFRRARVERGAAPLQGGPRRRRRHRPRCCSTRSPPIAWGGAARRRFALCQPEPLRQLFEEAWFSRVEVGAIEVPTVFRDFEGYWTPFLASGVPAPAYCISLDEGRRVALRDEAPRHAGHGAGRQGPPLGPSLDGAGNRITRAARVCRHQIVPMPAGSRLGEFPPDAQ